MDKDIFLKTILREFYILAHSAVPNNYDAQRFSHDGIDRSEEFNLLEHVDYFHFFINNYEAFFTTYQHLKDELSQLIFTRLILFRLLGHHHVRIKNGVTSLTEQTGLEQSKQYERHNSHLKVTEIFGKLKHFEGVPFEDKTLKVDGWPGTPYSFVKKQYFLERPNITVRPELGDTVIDAGACFGDTALAFACATGSTGKIHSFEPLPSYRAVCSHNFEQNNVANRISVYPYAIGAKTSNLDKIIKLDGGGTPGFSVLGKEDELPMISIDDFVRDHNCAKISFIKMDIEGAELAALQGAKKTIARDHPKMAISIYHKKQDFIIIPHYLMRTHPEYDLYLEHYTIHAEETILYAIYKK